MAIQNAIAFIRQGQHDNELRNKLVKADTCQERQEILNQKQFCFSLDEFEEAYSLSLFKCQTHAQADALKDFRMWWLMLYQSPDVFRPL